MKFSRTSLLSAALVSLMTVGATANDQVITEAEIVAAQNEWGDALVAIATAHDEKSAEFARELAIEAVQDLYHHVDGVVLFKPTLAQEPHRFRTTEAGAISYFIGGDTNFPNDSGFALMGWRSVVVDNAAIFTSGNVGLSMGDVTFTDRDGNVVSVDKTWGFQELDDGDVVIVLHHSSLPYSE